LEGRTRQGQKLSRSIPTAHNASAFDQGLLDVLSLRICQRGNVPARFGLGFGAYNIDDVPVGNLFTYRLKTSLFRNVKNHWVG
jgi:hypothetical protein